MPAKTLQQTSTTFLSLRQHTSETMLEYDIRFRSAIARFESAMERAGPNRSPIVTFYVSHYESTVKPPLQCLQRPEKPAILLKEAMDKTRHEAAGISGNISALSSTKHTAAHADVRQFRPRSNDSRSRRPKWDRDARRDFRPREPRPRCQHPMCRKRVGHTPLKTASSANGRQVTRPVAVVTPLARQKPPRLARVPDV